MSVGDLKGGVNHIHIAGPDPGGSDGAYIHYEWPAGGTGASAGVDGNNAMRSYNEGDFNSIQSVETVEGGFPLRVERCEIREGCCGDGAFRGGFGLRREVRILGETAMLSVLSEKNVIPPYGVDGARPGAANRFTVERDGRIIEPSTMPGKVSGFRLERGDIVREETAGGGGHGDPLDRDPARVMADLSEGYLTPLQAERRYGVVLGADGALDAEATLARREELRAARLPGAARNGQRRAVRWPAPPGDRAPRGRRGHGDPAGRVDGDLHRSRGAASRLGRNIRRRGCAAGRAVEPAHPARSAGRCGRDHARPPGPGALSPAMPGRFIIGLDADSATIANEAVANVIGGRCLSERGRRT